MPPSDQHQAHPTREHATRRLPPDYRSRAARWRLFVMVAALMTVLVAMNEARKPETWAWMWRGQPADQTDREPVDTRLPGEQESSPSAPSSSGQGAAASGLADRRDVTAAGVDAAINHGQRGWQRVWDGLTYQDRAQLARLLRAARRGENSNADRAGDWQPLAKKLDAVWNELLTSQNRELLLSESPLPEESRRSALQSLSELEVDWNDRLKPAFDAAGAPRNWTDEERAALVEAETTVDEIALGMIRDDTVWRPDERTAWFRLLEKLQHSNPSELSQQSVGRVGFVQIFRQPDEYRGRVVTVNGTARLAYRVSAPKNDLGIHEFCLFWIQPDDDSNLPIVVYSLQPPVGFPELTQDHRKLHEPLVVTGYFFKRWVYRAGDGLNSVPLIVASQPAWSPAPAAPADPWEFLTTALGRYFWPVVTAGVLGLALAAWGIASLLNYGTRAGDSLVRRSESANDPHLDQLPATAPIEESLRQLADRDALSVRPESQSRRPSDSPEKPR